MKKEVLSLLSLVIMAILISGCATIAEEARDKGAPGFVTGGVESLIIQGPSRVNVGETITLKAIGYDAKSARIKVPGMVKPTWTVDDPPIGRLDKTEGESVKLTGLTPGVCYIKAVQGKAKTETMVEVK